MNITTTLAWLITAHFIQGLIGELHYARPPQKALLHCNDPIMVIQKNKQDAPLTILFCKRTTSTLHKVALIFSAKSVGWRVVKVKILEKGTSSKRNASA